MIKSLQIKSYKVGGWLLNSIIFFLLISIFFGCREDVLTPIIVEPEPEPVIVFDAYASDTSILYAKSITLFIVSSNVDKVTVNDTIIPILNGSKTYGNLIKDTTFVVKFYVGSKIVGERNICIKVAPIIVVEPNRRDSLIQRCWMYSQDSKLFSEDKWYPRNWDEDEMDERLRFFENGFYERTNKYGIPVENGQWDLVGQDSIRKSDQVFKIQTLNDTTLVLSIDYLNFGKPAAAITVYKGYKISVPN